LLLIFANVMTREGRRGRGNKKPEYLWKSYANLMEQVVVQYT